MEKEKQTAEQTATPEIKVEPSQETPESVIAALKEENARLAREAVESREDAREAKKGLSTAHSKLTERDRVLKSIDYGPQMTEINNKIAMLAAFIADNKGRTSGDFETEVKEHPEDLLAKFKALEAETKTKQAIAEAQTKGNEYKEKVEALGLTDKDDEYWEIEDMIRRNRFDLADRRIAKLTKPVPLQTSGEKKVEAPKEAEEERINRLSEEKARKFLEEKGYLKADKASPGGVPLSFQEIERGYAAGEISYEQYSKARKERNI